MTDPNKSYGRARAHIVELMTFPFKSLLDELSALQSENEKLQEEVKSLNAHKAFTDTVSMYVGNYKMWKAQSEFRSALLELGTPLSGEYPNGESGEWPTKLENVDLYLTKLSEAFLAIPSPEQKRLFKCYQQGRGDEFLTAKDNITKPCVTPYAQGNKP